MMPLLGFLKEPIMDLIAILFTKVFKVTKNIPFFIAMKVISEIEFKQKNFFFTQNQQKTIQLSKKKNQSEFVS